jgi:hypothetical protein
MSFKIFQRFYPSCRLSFIFIQLADKKQKVPCSTLKPRIQVPLTSAMVVVSGQVLNWLDLGYKNRFKKYHHGFTLHLKTKPLMLRMGEGIIACIINLWQRGAGRRNIISFKPRWCSISNLRVYMRCSLWLQRKKQFQIRAPINVHMQKWVNNEWKVNFKRCALNTLIWFGLNRIGNGYPTNRVWKPFKGISDTSVSVGLELNEGRSRLGWTRFRWVLCSFCWTIGIY